VRIPLSWLETFIDVPDDLHHVREICDLAGLEVSDIEQLGAGWQGMVAGRIRSATPLEGTALHRVEVETAPGELRLAVSGAPNISAESVGWSVATALPGATIQGVDPDGKPQALEVTAREIRGVRSEAVLLSEREVGLSDDHSGVLVLAGDPAPGTPLARIFGDTVIDFDLTPDLGRAFCVFGVARELGALLRLPVRREPLALAEVGAPGEGSVTVTIAEPGLCHRYLGAVIRGVTVTDSPPWMQRRLLAAGMRPINSIVDIGNYVMLEMGQPLHFFDLDKIQGPRIDVRRARPGEQIEALNGQTYALYVDTLVIADAEEAVAVACVIGGAGSAVTAGTTDVLLEAAHFDFHSIRRATQALKLRTDAAERFIKDVDPEWTFAAMRRATALVLELCPGARLEGYQDAYPVRPVPVHVDLTCEDVERVLGIVVPEADIVDILERFDFAVERTGLGAMRVTGPTFRKDLSTTADLIEEIARAWGMNNIPPAEAGYAYFDQTDFDEGEIEAHERAAQALVGLGFFEAINYSMVGADWNAFGMHYGAQPGKAMALRNPLTSDRTEMRLTLVPGLLRNVSDNLRYQPGVALFELGRAYQIDSDGRRRETELLAVATAGARRRPHWSDSSGAPVSVGTSVGIYDVKGMVTAVLARFGITDARWVPYETPGLLSGQTMQLLMDGEAIGFLGEVDPELLARFDIDATTTYVAELRLAPLIRARRTRRATFRPLPTQPPALRDISVIVPEGVSAEAVTDTARSAGGDFILSVELFDRYRGAGVPEGHTSFAFHLTFQHPSRTLQAAEVDADVQRVVQALADTHGARLRS
jgi:phenylalanyl-tRNA synthetase beta chain